MSLQTRLHELANRTFASSPRREGLGLSTGIELEKLVDAGEFICGVLQRETQSKVGRAMLAKRT